LSLSRTGNNIDTSRAVIFPGFFEREKASYNADTGQVFGEAVFPTRMGSIALEPFAGLAYVQVPPRSKSMAAASLPSMAPTMMRMSATRPLVSGSALHVSRHHPRIDHNAIEFELVDGDMKEVRP
jgi:hypothetical protein